jgi:Xaa-Pro dipeptidase
LDVHAAAIQGIAELLCAVGVLCGEPRDLCEQGLVQPFMPHGVGHQLGVQVHDVGGTQAAPRGGVHLPPDAYPMLRNTRTMEEGHVVTVEPGLYFIPMLLEPFRTGERAGGEAFDWDRVDSLLPCGGIRIEDDVLVTTEGREDLTRPWVPGHRAP